MYIYNIATTLVSWGFSLPFFRLHDLNSLPASVHVCSTK